MGRHGMPFEPDATQVGLARGAADRAMAKAKKTPGPQQIGEWTARELRAFRIEDAARLETLAETPVMLKAEPAEMLGNGPLGDVATDEQIERAAKAMCELGTVEWDVQEEHRQEHFRKLARAAFDAFGAQS